MIYAAIPLVPFDIFVAILDCSDGENDDKREDDKSRRYGAEFGEELKDVDGKKKSILNKDESNIAKWGKSMNEHVSNTTELFQQVSRYESEHCVFRRHHLIRNINMFFLDTVFVVKVVWREGFVYEY